MRVALWVPLLFVSSLAIAQESHRAAARPTGNATGNSTGSSTGRKPGEGEFTGCERYPAGKRFHWGVRGEVGLPDLVASLGEIGCETILVGPAAAARGGKVSLEVPDLLTAAEVYKIFYSSLEAMGLTIEAQGKVLKVVDAARAKEVSTVLGEESTPSGDQFVTRLIRLEHASVQEVGEVLGKLHSREGDVTIYPAGPSLIVTDRASAVRRMEELARALDVAQPGERIFTIATHGQSATDLATTIERVLLATRRPQAAAGEKSAAPRSADSATVVPVDGARMIVVIGGEPGYRRVLALAERIDPPAVEGAGSQTHVIYLAHTNAEEMSATLKEIGLTSRAAAGRPAVGAPQSAVPLQGEVRIGADKVSNSIIVFAAGPDYLMVRDLISKLDLPRRQVYVEATILDLSIDKARNLGLALHGGQDLGGGTTGFVSNQSSSTNSLVVDTASLVSLFGAGGLTAGVFGKALQFGGVTVPSFGVVLQALESSKDVNVISRPHLLTMDNTKASLSVGQSIPFQTQALGAATTSVIPAVLSTYSRQDVALKLELTPHLNDSDSIRLEIDGEISDVPDGQNANLPGGPITDKRTLKTAVVVGDGETVVLGGLQKESESESIEKIPGLGDIPLIGRLFQFKSRQKVKQDLLIILTPYVIRGPEDLRRIYERKQSERREFLERFTAFQGVAWEQTVDYRRKRGLLEEINLTARRGTEDAQALRDAERSLRRPPIEGPVE